jgi:hypothetical protein
MAWENKTSVSWQAATRKKVDWRTCYSSIAVYHSLQDLNRVSPFDTPRLYKSHSSCTPLVNCQPTKVSIDGRKLIRKWIECKILIWRKHLSSWNY